MKNIVIFDDYHERDLKPPELLREYLRLTEQDVRTYLLGGALEPVVCPGCLTEETLGGFDKFGLTYVECANCHTVYVDPRPSDADLDRYARESEARRFWREELAARTGSARREKIVKPRFEWIVDTAREYLPDAAHYLDVATAQQGYVEELAAVGFFTTSTLLDPALDLDLDASDAGAGAGVRVAHTGDLGPGDEGSIDAASLMEVTDRTADVEALMRRVRGLLRPDGLLFVTAVLASGFDLQTLWDKADNLFPPDRLNAFTVEGLGTLLERHGFEVLELSTPGILDLEIVAQAARLRKDVRLPRFVLEIIRRDDPELARAFTAFLQEHLLSSYGRVVARRSS